MNSDRIIKVLEWRPQISASSDNTYDPDDRKDLEECMLDVFRQFCEFKKKKYNLTLGTSLDTPELEDMDVAILICSIEKAFGIKQIPHDELASMDTFNDIATYINDYHKNKTFVINIENHKDEKENEQAQQPKEEKISDWNVGCLGWFYIVITWFAVSTLTRVSLVVHAGLPDTPSKIIGYILAVIAVVIEYGAFLGIKEEAKRKNIQ